VDGEFRRAVDDLPFVVVPAAVVDVERAFQFVADFEFDVGRPFNVEFDGLDYLLLTVAAAAVDPLVEAACFAMGDARDLAVPPLDLLAAAYGVADRPRSRVAGRVGHQDGRGEIEAV